MPGGTVPPPYLAGLGAQGLGDGSLRCGCLSAQALKEKRSRGRNPADITVHEWIHTLQGLHINGRPVPSNAYE